MNGIPYPLLVILIVIAVIAGLWVGGRAHDTVEANRKDWRAIATQKLRQTMARGIVSLWRWSRGERSARDRDER